MKLKIFTLKIKLRLIITLILIGVIPTITVGVFSYYNASKTIQKKVNEGNEQILAQTKLSTENLLFTADLMMVQFTESPVVKQSLTLKLSGDNFEIINNIENVINNLPSANFDSLGIDLVNFPEKWVLNGSGINKLDDYPLKEEYDAYSKMPLSSFWADNLSLKSKVNQDKFTSLDGVNLVKKSPLFLLNASSIAVLRISYSRLSELISNSKPLGQMLILGEDGCVLASTDHSLWGKDISLTQYVKEINTLGKNGGNFGIKIGGKNYSINYLKSQYNGWLYISVTSIGSITKSSEAIGWFTFIICIIIITLISIVALLISNRIYMPIRKLCNLVTGLQYNIGITNKQDELGFIEDRVNFLLKEESHLKNEVSIQIDQLKDFFVSKLVSSEMDKDIVQAKLKLYDYPLNHSEMCILVLHIDTLEGTLYNENEFDLVLFAINNIINDLITTIIVFKPFVIDEYQITIIESRQSNPIDFKNQVYIIAKKIQDAIFKILGTSVSIGISNQLHDYINFHQGYLYGIEALKHQIEKSYKAIIFIQDVRRNDFLKPVFPNELKNEILESIKACDKFKSRELLHEFVQRIAIMGVSRYEYQIFFFRLLTDMVFLLKDSREPYTILIKNEKSAFEQLLYLKTTVEIENWFNKSIIEPIIDCLYSSEKIHYNKIVEDTLNLIHEQYDTELTLEKCAATLNYHQSYIRRILKTEAGICFSDYLTQYRMDIAKKLLSETEMKISEISEKLTYKNPENFIRGFKKITGITPGQYRENNIIS